MLYKAAFVVKDRPVEYKEGSIPEIEKWVDDKFEKNSVMFRTEFGPIDLFDNGEKIGTGYQCKDMFATKEFLCIAVPLNLYNKKIKNKGKTK